MSAQTRVLISGFGPFPGHAQNPSAALVHSLAAIFNNHPQIALKALVLPTAFAKSYQTLEKEIGRFRPHLVIAFGVSAGGAGFRLESTARNRLGKRPDATGFTPARSKIDPQGPQTLRSDLNLRVLRAALQKAGLPVRVSKSAGDYVCNDLFYRLMRARSKGEIACPAGFIHIPYSAELSESYSGKAALQTLPAQTIAEGARLAIEIAAKARSL